MPRSYAQRRCPSAGGPRRSARSSRAAEACWDCCDEGYAPRADMAAFVVVNMRGATATMSARSSSSALRGRRLDYAVGLAFGSPGSASQIQQRAIDRLVRAASASASTRQLRARRLSRPTTTTRLEHWSPRTDSGGTSAAAGVTTMTSDTTARTSSTIEKRAERQARHAPQLRAARWTATTSRRLRSPTPAGVAPSKVARWSIPDFRSSAPPRTSSRVLPDRRRRRPVREVMFNHDTRRACSAGAREGDDAHRRRDQGVRRASRPRSATLPAAERRAPRDVPGACVARPFEAMQAAAVCSSRKPRREARAADCVPRVVTLLTPVKTTAGADACACSASSSARAADRGPRCRRHRRRGHRAPAQGLLR